MKLSKYGVTLHQMKEPDIEMVRRWRNDPSVVMNYEFREHITPEMQKEWFKSVNNIHNVYLVVEYAGEKIGVVNAKNIDWDKHTCESGIFLPAGKYSNTFIPAVIVMMTMEFGFHLFGLFKGYAHVLKTNVAVQKMILSLGYELCPGQEKVENQLYEITRENFFKRSKKLVLAMHAITGTDEPMAVTIYRDEFGDEIVKFWESVGKQSGKILRVEETPEARIYYLAS